MIAFGMSHGSVADFVSPSEDFLYNSVLAEVRVPERIVPMIHVPDVNATAQWYASIGFEIRKINRECDDGKIDWALLCLGQSEIMLNHGGNPSSRSRREFDLYTYVDDVNGLRRKLDGKAEIIEDLHDTFYGTREFIIRDCNGFWITFGQPTGADRS